MSDARDDRAEEEHAQEQSHARAMAFSLLGSALGTSLCAWLSPGYEQCAAFTAITCVCAVLSMRYAVRMHR